MITGEELLRCALIFIGLVFLVDKVLILLDYLLGWAYRKKSNKDWEDLYK